MSLFARTTPLRGKIFIFFLPLAFVLLSLALPGDEEVFKIGHSLPLADREMLGTDGKMHTLSSLNKENGLVVIFSCNTCPFVVGNDNFPGWERQYKDLHDLATKNGVGMVLVNSNEAKREGDDSMEAMMMHAESAGYTMPYLEDAKSELADAMEAKTRHFL